MLRVALRITLALTIADPVRILAQTPSLELQAGVGYARLFDAGGISFAAAVERRLSAAGTPLQHALGGSVWYARTGIASAPDAPDGRHLLGVGIRYQIAIARSSLFHPFLAVPVQLLHSSIPDRPALQTTGMLVQVPEPGPPPPVEDRIGGEWGWGTGLELGFRIHAGSGLSAHTSVQAVYQNIYGAGSRNGAWNWHAGLTYALPGS